MKDYEKLVCWHIGWIDKQQSRSYSVWRGVSSRGVVTCSVPDGDGSFVASLRGIRHGSLSE